MMSYEVLEKSLCVASVEGATTNHADITWTYLQDRVNHVEPQGEAVNNHRIGNNIRRGCVGRNSN